MIDTSGGDKVVVPDVLIPDYKFSSYVNINGVTDITSIKLSVQLGAQSTDPISIVPYDAVGNVIGEGTTFVWTGKWYNASTDPNDSEMRVPAEALIHLHDTYSGDIRIKLSINRETLYKPNGIEGYYHNGIASVRLQSYTLYRADKALDTNDSMLGFNKVENANSYNLYIPNKRVENKTTNPPIEQNDNIGAIISTSGAVDTVVLNIAAPALYTKSGAEGANVYLEFYYRKSNGNHSYADPQWQAYTPFPLYDDWNNIRSAKATKSETVLTLTMSLPSTDYYDIKVVRSTASVENPADITTINAVYLKEISEVSYEDLVYPCTALLGIRAKATDQLNGGMPNITSIVRGIKVHVPTGYRSYYSAERACGVRYFETDWDGTMTDTVTWTDNPVWCLYDLLTNERYGAGSDFKILPSRKNAMLMNFVEMAEYCDTYVRDDGTVTTYDDPQGRPRFSLNLVIDNQKTAREWVNTICGVMRATLFNCEGIVFLDIDREKEVTQIFNMSNITNYTQSSISFKAIPNAVQVQYPNMEKNYDLDSFLTETYDFQQNPSATPVVINLDLLGVTNDKDARSMAAYTLDKAITTTTTVTFKTGSDLLNSTVLDVIGVQHDVPMWGAGGRIKSAVQNLISSAADMSQFTLTSIGTVAQISNLGSNITGGIAYIKFSRTGATGSDFRLYSSTLTFDKSQSYVYSLDFNVIQQSAELWLSGSIVDNQPNSQVRLCTLNSNGTVNTLGTGVTLLGVSSPDASGYRRVSVKIAPSVFTGSGSTAKIGIFNGWGTIDTREGYFTRPQLEVGTTAGAFVDGTLLNLSSEFNYATAGDTEGSLYGDLSLVVSQGGFSPTALDVVQPTLGTHTSVVVQGNYPFTPAEGDTYILNFRTYNVKPFKIINLKRDTDDFIEVTALEYNGAIYGDDINCLGKVTEVPNFSTLSVPLRSSVTGFKVEKRIGLDLVKSYRAVIDIWYDLPSSIAWGGLVVAYCTTDDTRYKYTPIDVTGHVQIEAPILETADYQFVGISVWKDGTQQSIQECLNDTVNVPWTTIHLDATIPSDLFSTTAVQGLETVGYLDGSFIGKDCKIEWRPIIVVDEQTEATNTGAGDTQSAQLLNFYHIVIANVDGTVRRSTKVYDETYTYTHELNAQDGAIDRVFDFTVVAVDVFGRSSLPSTIRCKNPAPAAIT